MPAVWMRAGHRLGDARGVRRRAEREDAWTRAADGGTVGAGRLGHPNDLLDPRIEVEAMWLMKPVAQRLAEKRGSLRGDRPDEQSGVGGVEGRGCQRDRIR